MSTGAKTARDWLYERDQGPFLALCRGRFGFLHTSPDRRSGIAVRNLATAPLGSIHVPSGAIVAGDPFRGLKPSANPRYPVPAGTHPVIQTLAQVGEDDRIAALRTAYVSIVYRPDLMAERQALQRQALADGRDPAIGPKCLARATPWLPDGSFSEAETRRLLRPGFAVLTGVLGMADADLFEARMPANRDEPGHGWLETLFEHGQENSWFDQLDSDAPWPKGSSNHLLPPGDPDDAFPEANIVLCQAGWGDGRYQAFIESFLGQPIALHVDFQVIPSDPMEDWREAGDAEA